MSLILVIDAGTTGIRCVATDESLQRIHTEYESLAEATTMPHQGWVEQDPEAIWQATQRVIQATVDHVGLDQVRGLSLTTQRSCVLLLDQVGELIKPLTALVPWQDTRSAALCDEANSSNSLKAIQGGSTILNFFSRNAKFKVSNIVV